MNGKVLTIFLGIFILLSFLPGESFAQLASIASTATVPDTGSLILGGAVSVEIVTISGTTYAIIAADEEDGIQILDISTPSSPGDTAEAIDGGTFDRLTTPKDVDTFTIGSSTYAIVTSNGESGFQIIDITTPGTPVAKGFGTDEDGTFTEIGGAWGVTTFTISDTPYALVTGYSDAGAEIINLSDVDNPTSADIIQDETEGFTRLTNAAFPHSVVIGSSTYVLIPSFADSGVEIVNVTDPNNPVRTATMVDETGFSELGGAFNVTTFVLNSKTYAIVSGFTDDGIEIIDISTPGSPTSVSSVTDTDGDLLLDGAEGISVFTLGDRTYAIVNAYAENDDPRDGFQIFDITDVTHPIPIFQRSDQRGSFTEIEDAHDVETVTISGTTYAVIAGHTNEDGVQIVTFKEPVSGADTAEFVSLINDSNSRGKTFSMQMAGVNSTNHIFVANEAFHTIAKFNSTGIFLSNLGTNGTSGTDNDEFNLPHQVAHDSNDRVIVVDTGNDRVQVFTSAATSASITLEDASPTGASFDFPHDADVDSSNNIYVVDRDDSGGTVQKFSSDGSSLLLTLTGAETGATDFDEPLGVAIDSNDRIIVAQRGGSTDGFQIFDSSGNFVKRVSGVGSGDGQFSNPHDVAVDSSDRIYIADQDNNRIQIFDSSGTFIREITTGVSALSFPASVDIDSNGRIVVADTGNQQVVIFEGFGVKIADTEGSSQTVTVTTAGDAASFQYAETEGAETETVSLSVDLPDAVSGDVTVETVEENTVEQGVQLATATDITAPCTNTCTIQFTVPNDVLTAAGLSSTSASIYHDSDGDEILQADEAITTTRDTTTTAGSTIFTGSASFTSKFAVGGVVGTTAQATAGAAAAFGLFGLINTCDENGFGDGQSLMIYDIMYDKCTEQQVKVYADTTCGPMTVKIGDAYGTSIAGMSSNQPLLNNDTKKVIFNHPIESDIEWFSVVITDKKDTFTDKFYTNQCTGVMSFTGNTGYTSEQQGTSSSSEDSVTESSTESKLILPGNVVEVIPATPDTIDEIFDAVLQVDPEPMSTDLDSFSPELMIDPEPQELEIDPEPEEIPLWLQSFTEFWKIFIK